MRNPTRLHGTNFCTTSARFAPSFVWQPNGTKCTQIVRNAPKYEFRSQRGNRVCSLRKIMMRLHAKNFCASSARFALSFVRQPNGPKCLQIVQNTPKYEFRVQWDVSGAFLREIPTRLCATHFCTNLACFVLSFVTQPKCPKCTQIVRNAQKHEVRVQWGGSDASL